jgi:cytochrome b pre-mRNA-processing protein 3
MWILHARLRCLPEAIAKKIQEELKNHFFYAADERIATKHKINSGPVRNKYLKDIFEQWRGVIFAYDEGVIRGDAVLAMAVWTSIFKANDGVPVDKVAAVIDYVRSVMQYLDKLSDEEVLRLKVDFPSLMMGSERKRNSGNSLVD